MFPGRRARFWFVSLVVIGVLAPLATPASAHTAMLRASPDRDAIAGGPVQFIDLEFLDPITEAVVTVTYNGVPLAGRTTVADGEVITFTLDQPLTEPGRYQVSYEMISFDTDFTTGGFFFTFDPQADQVARLEPPGAGGFSPATTAISAAGLAVVVALLATFVWRMDGRRRDSYDDGHDGDVGYADYHDDW
ncbi:MAG: copper resistance protein CopC [Actinomycetota bacterium]